MYIKMALRNAGKAKKDYTIYCMTLSICVGLFYAFMSLSSSNFNPNIGVEYNIQSAIGTLRIISILISLVLAFLIKYTNDFMIKRKKKEYAVQIIMGMEQRIIALVFFLEMIILGVFSLIMGLLLGGILSELLSGFLQISFNKNVELINVIFGDTILQTVVFFMITYSIIALFNCSVLRKEKIIDMLHAKEKKESNSKGLVRLSSYLFLVINILIIVRGGADWKDYFLINYGLNIKIIFTVYLICPLIYFALLIAINKLMRNRNSLYIWHMCTLLFILLLSVINFNEVCKNYWAFNESILSIYLIYIIFLLLLFIVLFFYNLNEIVVFFKNRYIKYRYKDVNLFFIGQITSKLNVSSKTMATMCISLLFSIILLLLIPILTGWSSGYLKQRAVYDIQINSKYNNVEDLKAIKTMDYYFIYDFLDKQSISIDEEVRFNTYFLNKKDFDKRQRNNFPVLAVSLNDYNKLLKVAGEDSITLNDNEYFVQWKSVATEKERADFIYSDLNIGGEQLVYKKFDIDPAIGNTIYNTYTNALFVLPNAICSTLNSANSYLYINTKTQLSYSQAEFLQELFSNMVKNLTGGNSAEIRLRTIQVNNQLSSSFIIKTILLYSSVVLMIIVFTILSLQQLEDSFDHFDRFIILKKLGVEQKDINGLIFRQMFFWFLVPIFIALLIGILVIICIILMLKTEIMAYIGIESLLLNISISISILVAAFVCYFLCTFKLFKTNIKNKVS